MLLRRLPRSSRHLQHGIQTLTPAEATSSSPLPFRRLPGLPPSRVLSPRLLPTSGRDDDTNRPWNFAPWAKGFRAEDGENGGVSEEICKEAASAPPARGEAAPDGDEERWTLSGDEDKDPFAAAVLDEFDSGEGAEAEIKRQQTQGEGERADGDAQRSEPCIW